jgi:nitroimidazol reductase NimA-like FMN-containing flavoprotein (pyridoxamine 5'-phosphate oxidase superfamily)
MTTNEPIAPTASTLSCCPRSQVRLAKRASYDRQAIYELIDHLKTGHVAFIENNEPRCIPLTLWRLDDDLYLHVLNGGRLSQVLESSPLLCISFAETVEWVMSKSAYHHSANYRSAVLFGHPRRVIDDHRFDAAFEALIEQLEAGRWQQVRPPNTKERKATALFCIPMIEGALKSRQGGPNEEPEDLDLPVWNGVLPLSR